MCPPLEQCYIFNHVSNAIFYMLERNLGRDANIPVPPIQLWIFLIEELFFTQGLHVKIGSVSERN